MVNYFFDYLIHFTVSLQSVLVLLICSCIMFTEYVFVLVLLCFLHSASVQAEAPTGHKKWLGFHRPSEGHIDIVGMSFPTLFLINNVR